MSDDDSNDVVLVSNENPGEGTLSDSETRPIMQLFQRLISNDNKQNTILTNAQIISILLKEFNIDITTLHELEVDIYLNVVKRFLKDWPKWDEFDQVISTLRKKNANKSIKKTLESKYIELKDYLKVQLEITKPLAQDAVQKMLKVNAKRMEKVNTSDITLDIYCTRKQLNELILNKPITEGTESFIFNLTEFNPNSITLNKLPVECILNWWSFRITIDCKFLTFSRTTAHKLRHVLVNAKNGPRDIKQDLNINIQVKDNKRQTEDLPKETLFLLFENIMQSQAHTTNLHYFLQVLFEMVKSDLLLLQNDIKVPAIYRQFSFKYPYYRKLRAEVEENVPCSHNYDLYIEETLSPMHVINVGKVGAWDPTAINNQVWLTFECLECKIKFDGDVTACDQLREHFDMYHADEPNWTCTNCEETYTMIDLTQHKWRHVCPKK